MKDIIYDQFQSTVQDVVIRHASLLDIITKLQESSARVNRAAIKTITSCGCVQLHTSVEDIPDNIAYEELKNYNSTHLQGVPCPVCKDKIEEEIGNQFIYLAALCNQFDLNIYDILLKEYKNISTLGKFSLY